MIQSNQNSLNLKSHDSKTTLNTKNKKISKEKKKRTISQSQEEEFRITKTQYSKLKLEDLEDVKKLDFIPGTWSFKENKAYLKFLKKNKRFFKNQGVRRSKTVFQNLSKEIPTRSSEQCRSHHQKQVLKYKKGKDDKDDTYAIDKIIQSFEKKLNNGQQFQNEDENFQQNQKQVKKSIQLTNIQQKEKKCPNEWYKMEKGKQIGILKIIIKLQQVQAWF